MIYAPSQLCSSSLPSLSISFSLCSGRIVGAVIADSLSLSGDQCTLLPAPSAPHTVVGAALSRCSAQLSRVEEAGGNGARWMVANGRLVRQWLGRDTHQLDKVSDTLQNDSEGKPCSWLSEVAIKK